MTQYIVSQEASQDLEEIVDYFLTRNIEAGERFVKQFNKKCQNLATFPNLERIYADFSPSLRGIPLDSYIIQTQALHVDNPMTEEEIAAIDAYRKGE